MTGFVLKTNSIKVVGKPHPLCKYVIHIKPSVQFQKESIKIIFGNTLHTYRLLLKPNLMFQNRLRNEWDSFIEESFSFLYWVVPTEVEWEQISCILG